MSSVKVQIGVRGEFPRAVREELSGFVESPVPGGSILRGVVPDQASLLGVLERLHFAGLSLDDVERLDPGPVDPTRHVGAHPETEPGLQVRIQVEGNVAAYILRALDSVPQVEQRFTTTFEVLLADQDALFAVLSRLEASATVIREIHVAQDPSQTLG
ncbi:hypothetical protein [Ornithinimicrobium cryptoxanthini]|uniref:ACT domain-containing protein n=1 Tax=Ornithinimicrobium cryptoxanthini TaxID=2934161 RepID=A0ABY4YMN0_9MICO|nr:hypothetical protein [Ornithinimicrobium cryptoxanthini]USQ77854.1 hypothetical protein NF557_08180 [Ornithinimicrobium cryptoxanthini]